jgi:hypothetical protein
MLKYRHPTKEEDLVRLNEWVAEDPDHCKTTSGSFLIVEPDSNGKMPTGKTAIAVEDEHGVVFYLKFTNAVLVDTQFPPDLSEEERARRKAAISEVFGFFSNRLKGMGYHAALFESVSQPLVQFMERVGFKRLKDFFKVSL